MHPSPQQQIDAILQSLKEKGMAAAPVEQAMALAHSSPAAIRDLAVEVMQKATRFQPSHPGRR